MVAVVDGDGHADRGRTYGEVLGRRPDGATSDVADDGLVDISRADEASGRASEEEHFAGGTARITSDRCMLVARLACRR